MAKDSDATDKGLVACRLWFWAERRTALQSVDACQQSERYNKVCDPRSSWFVTLSYRRRAGSTGPTTLSHLALRAGSSTTMMAGDEPARVKGTRHKQNSLSGTTLFNYMPTYTHSQKKS